VARPIPEDDLNAIEAAVAAHPHAASAGEIEQAIARLGARRTLQYRLRALVSTGLLRLEGDGRAARYHLAVAEGEAVASERGHADIVPLSREAQNARAYVRQS